MDEKQHRRSRKSSRRMEEDLNRSSFRSSGDSAGPPPEKIPCASGAGPSASPRGYEPYYYRVSASQPQSGVISSPGAIPVIAQDQAPSQKGNAAPVAAPDRIDGGSNAEERGVDPEGFEHGADYGGVVATHRNSSLVSDSEAASRSEYRYQKVRGQASRTPACGDPAGRQRSGVRGAIPRSSSDHRQGESQSTQVLERIEDVMARMERQFAASTDALLAVSTAGRSAHPRPGEFNSFILILNC